MPYYTWRGITLNGKLIRGTLTARSKYELDAQLLKRDIALLQCKQRKPSWWWRGVSAQQKIDFLRQLSTLLASGMLLPEALSIVGQQLGNPRLQEAVFDLADTVERGTSLSSALSYYPTIFDPIVIQMVAVGQEAGTLSVSLALAAEHVQTKLEVHKKIRAAAFMPLITFVFFVIIALVIVVGVIPQFAMLFASFKQELPPLTRALLQASDAARGMYALFMVLLLCGLIFVVRLFFATEYGKPTADRVHLALPIFGPVLLQQSLYQYICAVAALQDSGVPLPRALQIARHSMANAVMQEQLEYLDQEVESGIALSEAMAKHPHNFFGYDVVAMVAIGERSGNCASMLHKVAANYQERINRLLALYVGLLQPLLLVIVGMLVALLMLAVYLPVLQLSHVAG